MKGLGQYAFAALIASGLTGHARAEQNDDVVITAAPADIAQYEVAAPASQVTVNGRPDHVYTFLHQGIMDGNQPTLPSNFTQFDLAPGRSATVVARFKMPITTVVVRPLRAGIRPSVNGNLVTFTIDHPGHYDVEVNDAISNPTNDNSPLLVFADPMEAQPAAGPDVTVFPTGKVTTLPGYRFDTQAHHTYVIPAGAVLRGVVVTDTQPDVTIRGHGIILYDHDVFAHYVPNHLAQLTPLFAYGSADFKASGVTVITATNQYTPSPVGEISPWAVVMTKSPHARLSNLKIINQFLDGLEFNGEQDASLVGSFVQAGDDTLGIKATCYGYKGGGAGSNPTLNVFADDETITTGPGSPMEITELNQPSPDGKPCSAKTPVTTEASRITYRNIDVLHASLRTRVGVSASSPIMEILNAYPVHVHDITYDGIVAEDVVRANFLAGFDLTSHSALFGANPGGTITDVHINNVHVTYAQELHDGQPLKIAFPGFSPTSFVANVNFTGLVVNGTHIVQAQGHKETGGLTFAGKVRLLDEKYPARNVQFH